MVWTAIARRQRFPKGAKASNPWVELEGAPCSMAEARERNLVRALRYDEASVYVVVWTKV
jgi:hypothetical protein